MAILALWATPRTVSTAFERMMIERGDHLVLDEPWSRAYYLGPDRRSARFPLCLPESTYDAVTAGVLRTGRARDVFVKDMAYQAAPGLGDADLAVLTHTFLIRHPAAALASFARGWPDFTADEAGYDAQAALFERVESVTGHTPPVLDSDLLLADPEGVVGAWCDAIGLEHRPEALSWEPGIRPEWPLWHDWYRGVATSTGFHPRAARPDTQAPDPAVDPDILERAVASYQRLRASALGG